MTPQNATTESFPVSRNVAEMQSSSTLKAMEAANALRGEGFDVIDLRSASRIFKRPNLSKNTPGKVCRKV
jgi:hypothetical protein